MHNKNDKRRASRIDVHLPAKYKVTGARRTKLMPALCKDIGGLGFGMIVNEPLKKNEQVKILIRRQDNKKTMFVNCKVVWCVKASADTFKVGTEISKVEDPLLFIEFIGDMLLNLRETSVRVCHKRRARNA
jgi:hypothetical protein